MKKLLIVVAISEEFKVIKKTFDKKSLEIEGKPHFVSGSINGYPVDALLTSMGMKAASQAAGLIIDKEKYSGVFIAGYCGGLVPALRVGDAVVAQTVRSSLDEKNFELDQSLSRLMGRSLVCSGVRYRIAKLTTEKLVVETPQDKKALFEKTGAEAVDMETAEIIRVAQERGVQAAAMKIVIDEVTHELPAFNAHFKKTGRMDSLEVGEVLAKEPELSRLLSKNMKHSAPILAEGVRTAVEILASVWKLEKHTL